MLCGTHTSCALYSGGDLVHNQDVLLHVALVLGAVRAVRAGEGGLLAALHLDVLREVAAVAVHLAALHTVELPRSIARHRLPPRVHMASWNKTLQLMINSQQQVR